MDKNHAGLTTGSGDPVRVRIRVRAPLSKPRREILGDLGAVIRGEEEDLVARKAAGERLLSGQHIILPLVGYSVPGDKTTLDDTFGLLEAAECLTELRKRGWVDLKVYNDTFGPLESAECLIELRKGGWVGPKTYNENTPPVPAAPDICSVNHRLRVRAEIRVPDKPKEKLIEDLAILAKYEKAGLYDIKKAVENCEENEAISIPLIGTTVRFSYYEETNKTMGATDALHVLTELDKRGWKDPKIVHTILMGFYNTKHR